MSKKISKEAYQCTLVSGDIKNTLSITGLYEEDFLFLTKHNIKMYIHVYKDYFTSQVTYQDQEGSSCYMDVRVRPEEDIVDTISRVVENILAVGAS